MTDVLERIRPVKEVPLYLKIMVYGRSGTGKTTFLGTMPKPLLVLDVREEGTASIMGQPDTDVVNIHSWPELEEVYFWLAEGNHPYKSVAVDTVTTLQDLAIMEETGGNPMTRVSQQMWGAIASSMKTMLFNLRNLPMHVAFAAQDRSFDTDAEADSGLDPSVGPYVMPSVAKVLDAMVGVIGQTLILEVPATPQEGQEEAVGTETRYCMRIGPHPYYMTKIRRDPSLAEAEMPKIIPNPTFGKILAVTLGKGKTTKKATTRKGVKTDDDQG